MKDVATQSSIVRLVVAGDSLYPIEKGVVEDVTAVRKSLVLWFHCDFLH